MLREWSRIEGFHGDKGSDDIYLYREVGVKWRDILEFSE